MAPECVESRVFGGSRGALPPVVYAVNRYAALDPYACDCDTSTGPGACDIFDFLCFQNAYSAGCP